MPFPERRACRLEWLCAVVFADDADQQNALCAAAGANSIALIVDCLTGGCDVSLRDRIGRAPLHRAAESGAFDAAALLLAAGVDPDATDAEGNTALHYATRANDWEIVRLLTDFR
jgi:ankyrin repeat protein